MFVVPTDLPALNAMSELAANDMFPQGPASALDYQALDWGTVLPRLANKEGLDKGGWSVWCNYIPGDHRRHARPPTPTCAASGRAGHVRLAGPPPGSRRCASEFLDATTLPEQHAHHSRAMQLQAWQDVPYIPTGAWVQPFRLSSAASPASSMVFRMFHNIRKA